MTREEGLDPVKGGTVVDREDRRMELFTVSNAAERSRTIRTD